MAAVSSRPWVSTTPTSGALPSACSLRAAASIAQVLPTPADAPK